jgi:PAS domain S-box-containing protein
LVSDGEIGRDGAPSDADRLKSTEAELAATVDALAQSEARFRAIADSMPQMVWSTRPDGFHDYYNARWYEFTGVPDGTTDGEAWNGMFHPEDQDRAWARWKHSLDTGEPYEIEYRLRRHDGVYRWTLGRAMPIRDENGRITRWFGTCTDIDDLKRMEQAKELLSQELSHRIKNIFAVVSALVALSARQHPEARAFATALRTRISALASAHEFVRPHTETSRPTVGAMTLHAFLKALFAAYIDDAGRPRIVVTGDDTVFDDQAATSVALLFHELATNASKYGALSCEEGAVTLETSLEGDRFHFCWIERGGPPVSGAPERRGFGSSLAELSVEGQLGGALSQDWNPEGLRVFVDLPATALSRRRHALKSMSGSGHPA